MQQYNHGSEIIYYINNSSIISTSTIHACAKILTFTKQYYHIQDFDQKTLLVHSTWKKPKLEPQRI